MKAAVIYWSKGGNTEKAAQAVKEGLKNSGIQTVVKRVEEAGDIDLYDYDLICLGFPSYHWHPPEPVAAFLKSKFSEYRQKGFVKVSAPKVPGKNALVFCTYSGPHTGINEAIPAGKYAGQFFEHFGFTILDEWYIVGEFHGSEEHNTKGRLGNIKGRPNEKDLEKIRLEAANLRQRMQ